MSEQVIDQATETTSEAPAEQVEQEQEQQEELTPEQQEEKAKADAETHKRSVQDRINKSVAKQREAERERDDLRARLAAYEAQANQLKEPDINDFDDLAAYQKAEREYGRQQALAEARQGQSTNTQQAATQALVQTYQTQEAELAKTVPDYAQVISVADAIIGEQGLPPEVSLALLRSGDGARIGYEICKDTNQLIDFLGMSPTEQIIRIGEVKAGLPKRTAKTPSAANLPQPITPTSGNASTRKDVYKMSTDDFIAHRNKTARR